MLIKLLIFILVSIGIVRLSWTYLRARSGYGFFRFFAFETLLVLVLLNIDPWFDDPFSPLHIISWILLIVSLLMAIHGFRLLRLIGCPRDSIEDTSELVVEGAYRFIRHPLYASLLVFAGGVFFKDVSLIAGLLFVWVGIFLTATARVEEQQNLERFGAIYADYMKTTKMFIPLIF